MYCAKCREPLPDDAKFCTKCGAAVPPAGSALNAGFWRRYAAYLVDGLVLIVPSVAVVLAARSREPWSSAGQVLVYWLYKALMESGPKQATLGKMALGIKVTDLEGGRISFASATGRFFGMFVSTITLGIGFLMAAFTRRKQALHDMMAGCVVVRSTASDADVREGSGTMPLTGGVWAAVVVFMALPVIGILAAIAIPAYQDYVIRAKMMEVIQEGVRLKADAAKEFEAYRQGGSGEAMREMPPGSQYVARIVIDRQARAIDVVPDGRKLASLIQKGAKVRFVQAADGSRWDCEAEGVPNKYLPASCRH